MRTIKLLKLIFFGRVFLIPFWFIYMMVGGIINCFSTSGINGEMEGFPQTEAVWPATVGWIILGIAVPGFIKFLLEILVGWYNAIFKKD